MVDAGIIKGICDFNLWSVSELVGWVDGINGIHESAIMVSI